MPRSATKIRSSLKNLWVSVAILVGLTVAGTVGLMVVGDRGVFEAVYLTVVILTTVGMDSPASDAEKVWALLLMVVGIGTVLYATGQLVSFVVEGHLKQMIGRRKVTERIRKLEKHIIVAGFGRMGQALCATLAYRDKPFVLIESGSQQLRDAEELGYLCIEGNAMHESTLVEAGVDRAGGMVTCLSHDADNVLIVLTARGGRPDLLITARCDEAETESKLRRAGADRVISPAVIGAARASYQLLNPQADDVMELDGYWPDLELARIVLSRFPKLTARPLSQVYELIGQNTIVVAMIKGDGTRLLHPPADTTVHPCDQLVVIGNVGCTKSMVTAFSGAKAA